MVVETDDLSATLEFFIDRLEFRLEMITPADSPRVAVGIGHGTRLRIEGGHAATAGTSTRLRLAGDIELVERLGPRLVAPNGTVVDVVATAVDPVVPPSRPSFELSQFAASGFDLGRAGMGYRDLLPSRQGGRYIASHIRIEEGGPVADYVHYHRIRFQMIYCRRGWARLVYEDQGAPFMLEAGDCVLQPPEIRHQVLESSAGLEVVEIGCPADHETLTDPALGLPTDSDRPDRRFGGQRFVRHVADQADWIDGEPGLRHRDLGIAAATDRLASARVLRSTGQDGRLVALDEADLHFLFLCDGEADLRDPDGVHARLGPGDAVTLPSGSAAALSNFSADFEGLEVTVAKDDTTLT